MSRAVPAAIAIAAHYAAQITALHRRLDAVERRRRSNPARGQLLLGRLPGINRNPELKGYARQ